MESIRVTYRLRRAGNIEERADELALEQTVELPREVIARGETERAIVGRVETIETDPRSGHRVVIAYPAEAAAGDPAQLLNLLFGNASLQDDVELVDVEISKPVGETFGGPRFGIEGIRAAAGVAGRPLACAALKPMGLSPEDLARLCFTLAAAGIDVVKDDHGLADAPFCPFEERVEACQAAVERAAVETGHRAVYAPNLIGSPEALDRQLQTAQRLGAGAVVAAPFVIGLPAFHELVRKSLVPVLAHPALAGGPRIATALLLGTLFRLYGADAVIFPHVGGRFPFSAGLCQDLATRLRRPEGGLRPSLPVPAGGMSIERVREMVRFYGTDVMLLVGGTLYLAGDALGERAREFVEGVHGVGGEAGARTESGNRRVESVS